MGSRRLPLYVAGGAGVSAVAAALGLTLGQSGTSATKVTASPSSTVITTRNTALGQILVDAQGRTMYLFAKDTGPASHCQSSCASAWPPVPVTGVPHASGGARAASVAVISRSDGERQVTYAGHPLYYFTGDSKVGQTQGQAVTEFGAKWYTLTATGRALLKAPSSASDNTKGGVGGGYSY